MDFGRDNVGFNLEINNGVDEEGNAGAKCIKTEQKCDDGTSDETTEHRNQAEDAGNETKRKSEAWRNIETEANDEDGNGGSGGIEERNSYGARNISGDGVGETVDNTLDAFGVVIFGKIFPKFLSEGRTFSEHEESEYKGEDKDGKETANGTDGGANNVAEIADHFGGEFLDNLVDLVLEIGDAKTVTDLINEANVASGVVD